MYRSSCSMPYFSRNARYSSWKLTRLRMLLLLRSLRGVNEKFKLIHHPTEPVPIIRVASRHWVSCCLSVAPSGLGCHFNYLILGCRASRSTPGYFIPRLQRDFHRTLVSRSGARTRVRRFLNLRSIRPARRFGPASRLVKAMDSCQEFPGCGKSP
jgi:hypothetical protein